MKYYLCFALYVISFSVTLFPQTIDSTLHSGNWSDPAIWSNGIPSTTDSVIINHNLILDVNVSMTPPGMIYISNTGELCGHYDFTGRFINYGPLKIENLKAVDTCESYSAVMVSGGYSGINGEWIIYVSLGGSACVGCSFTCNPIIPWQTPVADFNSNTTICSSKIMQFTDISKNYSSSWLWSFPGGTPATSSQQNPSVTYNISGVYNVTLIAENSLGSDTMIKVNYITVLPSPNISVSPDVTITHGNSASLSASGGGSYNWNNGSTDSTIIVSPTETTVYCVTATDSNNCSDTACVTVNFYDMCATGIYLPSAFSPNNDGENDFLQVYYENILCVTSLHIIIYDRWGEKLFESTDPVFKWDGTFNGAILNTQVVAYSFKANLIDGKEISRKGNISLVR